MEYKQGNIAAALSIAKNNLKDAGEGKFVITSVRSGEYISTELFLIYLKDRVNFFESNYYR